MNEITDNVYDGIILIDSSNNNFISNNSISGHHLSSIYLGDNSSFNCIECNNIYSNMDGIVIELSHSNKVSRNKIDFSEQFGISLTESYDNIVEKNIVENSNSYGLNLIDSDDNIIEENTIEHNNESGISLFWSSRNVIRKNKFDHNAPLHIQLRSSSEENIIYLNNFLNNSCSISDFSTNSWDFKGKGNYWSDYINRYPDAKKQWLRGVWDIPYEIPDNDNEDGYPLIKKWPNSLFTILNSQNTLFYFFYHLFLTQKNNTHFMKMNFPALIKFI